MLDHLMSQQLREQLLVEIEGLTDGEGLALWAHTRLAAKNTLTAADARIVEAAYQAVLQACREDDSLPSGGSASANNDVPSKPAENSVPDVANHTSTVISSIAKIVTPITKPTRRRSKAHLAFVAAQPCLICKRSPCDAHHLKFMQPNALGRKVSDEFTVPLCRDHHQDLHRKGNEVAWWANLQITPVNAARELWRRAMAETG